MDPSLSGYRMPVVDEKYSVELEAQRSQRSFDSDEGSWGSDQDLSDSSAPLPFMTERRPEQWNSEDILRWLIIVVNSPPAFQVGITDTNFPFEQFNQLTGKDLKRANLHFLPAAWRDFLLHQFRFLIEQSKPSHSSKEPRLWRFIRDELLHPETPSRPLVQWVNREDGVFQIVDSTALARKWGVIKSNCNMTYAHLSRGIRYYYKNAKKIILPVPNRRLTYKFGPDSDGW